MAIIGKRGRYGTNTAILIVAFIGVLLLMDVVAFRVSQRSTWARADVTATKQFSLADQTRDILRDLPEPVEAIAFFVPGDPTQEQFRQDAEDLLAEFERRSTDFDYRFVDPDRNPGEATRFGVRQYPTIAFFGTHSQRVSQVGAPRFQERDFATALLIATGVERKQLYVLTGHGERDAEDFDPGSEGFGFAIEGLFGDNYAVEILSLLEIPEIPPDAAVVIVAGPTKELEEQESEALHSYLKGGGRAIFLLEPNPPQSFRDLLARWGIRVNDGIAIDLGSFVAGQAQTPLIQRRQYLDTLPSITTDLEETFLPGSTGFDYPGLYFLPGFQTTFDPEQDPPPDPTRITFLPLAGTSLLSCMTPDLDASDCQGEGTRFGLSLLSAMAINAVAPIDEEPDPEASRLASIVLIGDSDFVTNKYFYSRGNSDFFLNSVNWLTEDIALSSARPKPRSFRLLVLTRPEMRFIQYSSWLLLPVGILLLGAVAWWRRR